MSALFSKYFTKKFDSDDENMQKLEELTERMISKGSVPENPIMQVLIELSEHGVLGLDENGVIIFSNVSALDMLKRERD